MIIIIIKMFLLVACLCQVKVIVLGYELKKQYVQILKKKDKKRDMMRLISFTKYLFSLENQIQPGHKFSV